MCLNKIGLNLEDIFFEARSRRYVWGWCGFSAERDHPRLEQTLMSVSLMMFVTLPVAD